jgi:hypothetical protein
LKRPSLPWQARFILAVEAIYLQLSLLSRNTRRLSLTEAGKAYAMLDELQANPVGTLKISIPRKEYMLPKIKYFLAAVKNHLASFN